jgi:serine/threonine protein kinase
MSESPSNDPTFESAPQAFSCNDATVDAPPDTSQDAALQCGDCNDATVDAPPSALSKVALESSSQGDATVDAPPSASSAGDSQSPSPNEATVDAPQALSDNGQTVDHVPAEKGDGEGASFTVTARSGSQAAAKQKPMVANYEVLGVLGRGAVGVVYKARQMGLNRLVALKMLLAGSHAGQRELMRFRIEAEAVARLRHPNIVQVYEVGEHNELPFFSLEFVEGGSLHSKMDGKPLPPRVGAGIMEALCRAMHYAHQNNIIHRDLKPANVLMTPDGTPKITDFGLAKRLEASEDSSQTRTGTLMGTPSYMPPEQAEGRTHDIGPLSDQYTLGAILYELLTGRPPFLGATLLETIQQVRNQEPVPPTHLQATTPRDLEVICLRALQKEPGKRYADAGEMADDLHRFLSGEPIKARPVSKVERFWRWCKRNPRLAAALAAIFLLLAAGCIGSTWAAITIRAEKEIAITEKDRAEKEKTRAEENEQKATASEQIAQEQAELALNTLGVLINKVQNQLSKQPGVQQLKRDLLQTAMDGLKRVAGASAGKMRRSTGDAYFRMGGIAKEFGNTAEAFEYWQRYYEMARDALAANPDNERLKVEMAYACRFLGETSAELHHDFKKALSYHQAALELRKELAAVPLAERMRRNAQLSEEDRLTPMVNTLQLSEEYTRVGLVYYYLGDSAHAEAPVLQSLRLREAMIGEVFRNQAVWTMSANPVAGPALLAVAASLPHQDEVVNGVRMDLSRNYHLIGEIYFRLKNLKEALAFYQKCEEIREGLLKEDERRLQRLEGTGKPQIPDFRLMNDTAEFHGMYANLLLATGAPLPEVLRHDERAVELSRKVMDLDKSVEPRMILAGALYGRGVVAVRSGNRGAAAAKDFAECLEIRRGLVAKDPKNYQKRMDLLQVLPRAGRFREAAQLAAELRVGHEKDAGLLVQLASCFAQCSAAAADDPALRQQYLETALATLESALALGYKEVFALETEPDLDPLRTTSTFKRLLDGVKGASVTSAKDH